MSIKKTTQAASPSDKNSSVYMDKATSQLYIVAEVSRGPSPASSIVTLWDVSNCKPKEVPTTMPLTDRGFCPVNGGDITLAIATRSMGHVEEQIAELEENMHILKSVESACKKIISDHDQDSSDS
jgi:hypothetical protein